MYDTQDGYSQYKEMDAVGILLRVPQQHRH